MAYKLVFNPITGTFDYTNTGDVVGPASATNSAVALFDGTTGKLIKDSLTTISTDGTFASNLDTLLPTEKATKTYVASAISSLTTGAASSTDNAVVRFDGTTGKIIQNSTWAITDNGIMYSGGFKNDANLPVQIVGTAAQYGVARATDTYGLMFGSYNASTYAMRVVSATDAFSLVINNTVQALTIETTGNVGIGSVGSLCKLYVGTVAGSYSDSVVPLQINAASAAEVYMGLNKGATYGMLFGYRNNVAGITAGILRMVTADNFEIWTNNTTRAVAVTSTGNFYIGNVAPVSAAKLIVQGDGGDIFSCDSSGGSRLYSLSNAGLVTLSQNLRINGAQIYAGSSGDALIYHLTSGKSWVVLANTTDRKALVVAGPSTGTMAQNHFEVRLRYNATGNEFFVVSSSGYAGINVASPHSWLHVSGSAAFGYVAKTADYTLDVTDYTVECATNSFTITLPTAVGITGRIYNIKNSGSGKTITLNTTSSQTIDGMASGTLTVAYLENLQVQSNGANWIIL